MDLVPVTAKYTLPAFLMFLIATGVTSAQAVPYRIGQGGSNRLELTVEKTGLLSGKKHAFTFSRFEASLAFNRDRLESSTVTISIESNSILCHDTWLSAKDLRKVQDYAQNDMLAVARYPQIKFRSASITKTDQSRYRVEGFLTIREVTKPVTVMASLSSGPGEALSLEGSAIVRLTDFNLNPPKAALGTIGTKNEMPFRFVLTATRANDATNVAGTRE